MYSVDTYSTGVQPHIAIHQGGEPGQAPHGLVRDVLTHGVTSGQPLVLGFHQHVVTGVRIPTTTGVGAVETGTTAFT